MNILKKCAVLATASALLLAGCQNSFTGSSVDTSALATRYSAARTNVGGITAPTITGIGTGTGGVLAKAADQVIKLSFSAADDIDTATVASAVTVRNLAAGATAYTVHGQGATIATTLKTIIGSDVYLTLSLVGASDVIEVQLNSAVLTGKNGTLKLDRDGDNNPGEGADDDYYTELPAIAAGTLTGVARNPQAGISLTTVGFDYNGTPTPVTFTNDVNRFRVYFDQYQYDDSDYASLLKSVIVIETYNSTTNAWDAVTVSSTAYDNTTGLYTANFGALSEGSYYRARLIQKNLKSIKAIRGFTQSYNMTQTAANDSIISGPTPACDYTRSTLSTGNQATIFASSSVVADGAGKNVKIVLDVSGAGVLALTGANGIDASTVTTANIKLYNSSLGVFVPFTIETFAASGSTVVSTIVLTLTDTSYVKGTNTATLYLGPALKTKGDTTPGVYARKFGDPTNVDAISDIRGFYALTGLTL